jgi:hypothetical protein
VSPAYDVFTLGANAEYDGEWQGVDILKARAGVATSLSFEALGSLCHGVELGATGTLTASAGAVFAMVASASGEARGVASAGVKARAILAPDPFDELGLVLDVGAWAEASAAARLALGLDTGQILALAGLRLKGLPFELFRAFLDEVRVEAGVWGMASAAAKARAHLACSGQLRDDGKAGFTFEFGAGAALGVGAGWDFFGGARLDDPNRMVTTAARLVAREIAAEARRRLGVDAAAAVQLLDLALPIVLRCGQEIGAAAAHGQLGARTRLLEAFIRVAEEELRAWAMRRVADAAERLVADAIELLAELITGSDLDGATLDALRAKLETARALVPDDAFTLEAAVALAGPLVEAAETLLPDEVAAVRRPLTMLWLALASADALWDREAYGDDGLDVALASPPQPVVDELTAVAGAAPATLRVSDAIGYLADTTLLPVLADLVPELDQVLDLLESSLGIGSDEIAELLLRGVSGGSLATTAVYQKLRGILAGSIERLIDEDLLPHLADALPGDDERSRYVDDVARPAMVAFARLVLAELDDVAAGNTAGAFDGAFQTALGTLTAKLVGGSAVVLGDVLFDHLLTSIQVALDDLHTRVAGGQVDAFVDAIAASVTRASLVPPAAAPSRQALTRLATDLIDAARTGSGPLVWTPRRRADLRSLLIEAFADFGGPAGDADRDALRDFFTDILDCNFIPHPQELAEAGVLLAEIGADQAIRTIPPSLEALQRFTLTLTVDAVAEIDRVAREFFDAVGELIDDLIRRVNELTAQINAAIAAAEAALRQALELTGSIANRLRSPTFRAAILTQARADAIAAAIAVARSVPGFDLLSEEAQNAAIGVGVAAFDVAWNAARPLMDLALKTAADAVAAAVETILAAADGAAAALDDMRDDLEDRIKAQLGALGVVIPNLTGADLAKIAKDLLLTDELVGILEQARQLLDQEQAKRQQADDLAAERLLKEGELARERQRGQAVDVSRLGISILSPLPFDPRPARAWKYGSRVPVSVRIRNGGLNLLDEPRRVLLALNGRPVAIGSLSGAMDPDLRVHLDLRAGEHPLVAGMNVLECTVVDGLGGSIRQTVAFACDPAVEVIGGLEVDASDSVFDTSFNDHDETAVEQVTLFNGSGDDVLLAGWRMLDAKAHVFGFPSVSLLSGQRLTIHTGAGRDTDTDIYWGRPQAIWNNRGDVLQLVDDRDVLQLTYRYGRRRSR